MTATGIEVAASEPAGTSIKPVALCPAAAEAVPTVKAGCWARDRVERIMTAQSKVATRRFVMAGKVYADAANSQWRR
jgi:hypothetical protein